MNAAPIIINSNNFDLIILLCKTKSMVSNTIAARSWRVPNNTNVIIDNNRNTMYFILNVLNVKYNHIKYPITRYPNPGKNILRVCLSINTWAFVISTGYMKYCSKYKPIYRNANAKTHLIMNSPETFIKCRRK